MIKITFYAVAAQQNPFRYTALHPGVGVYTTVGYTRDLRLG